jgi:hypothetical protein
MYGDDVDGALFLWRDFIDFNLRKLVDEVEADAFGWYRLPFRRFPFPFFRYQAESWRSFRVIEGICL